MKYTDEIYAKAVELWGEREQSAMAMEEAGELIRAINKMHRNPSYDHRKNLIEELADNRIMAEQLMIMYNISEDDIRREENRKISRLETLINE